MPANPRNKRLRFHESTQRALCRMVFLWLALVPVLCVASYSTLRLTPWYQGYQKDFWQRRLSDNLGVDVQFRSIEFPSPNQFRAYGLVCFNPETSREILNVAQANVAMDRSGWSVDLVSPELNGQQIQSAMQSVHDWFLCRPQKTASLLKLSVPELVVDDGPNKLKFQNVEVGLKPSDSTSTLIVTFLIDGQKSLRPASLRVDRDHIEESTKWSIESRDVSIPCRMLSERFSALQYLGAKASFRGTIGWWQKKQNWRTSIRGDVQSVDLALASFPFHNPLQGFGELRIDQADVIDGDVHELRGSLTSESCFVDTAWLDEISRWKMLHAQNNGQRWMALGPKVSASLLGVGFKLTQNGLVFGGGISDPKNPSFAAYVGDQPVACTNDSVASFSTVSDALSAYMKPKMEQQPARIADGRR